MKRGINAIPPQDRQKHRETKLEELQQQYGAAALLRKTFEDMLQTGSFGPAERDSLSKQIEESNLPERYKKIGGTFIDSVVKDAQVISQLKTECMENVAAENRLLKEICGFVPQHARLEFTATSIHVLFDDRKELSRSYTKDKGDSHVTNAFYDREKTHAGFADACLAYGFGKLSPHYIAHEEQHASFDRMRRATYFVDHAIDLDAAYGQMREKLRKAKIKISWDSEDGEPHDWRSISLILSQYYDMALDYVSESAANEILAEVAERAYTDRINLEDVQWAVKEDKSYGPRYVQDEKRQALRALSGVRVERLFGLITTGIPKKIIDTSLAPLKTALDRRVDSGMSAVLELFYLGYAPDQVVNFLILQPLHTWPKVAQRVASFATRV